MKYIAYVRKSTDDKKKQIQSIPNQLEWIDKTSQVLSLEILETFIDKKSAKEPGREGFNEMMQYVEKSKEPLGILCWKISRLARNPIDEGALKYAFMKNKIKHIYASDRQFREGENQILMGVEFGASTQYSIDLSNMVQFGMKRKIESGHRPTSAPIGYLNDPLGIKGAKKIYKDPERFYVLKKAWQKLLSGAYSVEDIRKELQIEGITTRTGNSIALSTLHCLFRNPFYAGYYYWQEKRYEGKHPKMISIAEFEKAQKILNKKGKALIFKHEFPYNGLLSCGECGYGITTDSKTKILKSTGRKKTYTYLRCTKKSREIKCTQKHIKQEYFENQLLLVLEQLQISQPFVDWVFTILRKNEKASQNMLASSKAQLTKQHNICKNLIQRHVDNLNAEIIDEEQYKEAILRYRENLKSIEQEMAKQTENSKNWIDRAYTDFSFAVSLSKKFKESDKIQRKEIIGRLGSNWEITDGMVLPELFPVYQLIIENQELIKGYKCSVEPPKMQSRTTRNLYQKSKSSIWSRFLNEVRKIYCENIQKERY